MLPGSHAVGSHAVGSHAVGSHAAAPRQKRKPPRQQQHAASPSLHPDDRLFTREPKLRHRHSMPRGRGSSAQSAALRRTRSFVPVEGARPSRRSARYSDSGISLSGSVGACSAVTDATLASAVASVDSALEQFLLGDGSSVYTASGAPAPSAEYSEYTGVPANRTQLLEAEVLRLRKELVAARRGAHVSEGVDAEMRRVKRLWHESEHRLLLVQSELRTTQVTQRAVSADLRLLEETSASQAQRIDELVSPTPEA